MTRWFLLPATVLALVLTASGCMFSPWGDSPTYPKITPPAGMTAVTFDNFGFAVPDEWQETIDSGGTHHWEDASGGTLLTAGVYTMPDCPEKAELRRSRGNMKVTSYAPLTVAGAAGGARVGFDRPSFDVYNATNLLAWLKDCQTKLSIEIYATGQVVDDIAATVVAQEDSQ